MTPIDCQEIKRIQLQILDWFDDICKKHDITYYLSGGTLLGAIRHKGYIPWDDDIDLMMLRSEYDRFLEVASTETNDKYEVRCLDNGLSLYPFIKIVDKTTFIKTHINQIDGDNSIWIDVFPMDGLPENVRLCYWHYMHCRYLRKLFGISTADLSYRVSLTKQISKTILHLPAKLVGPSRWVRMLDKYSKKYSVEESAFIGVICWGYGFKERMPKKQWCQAVEVTFEGRQMLAPGCWDLYLSNLYGDYMTLPPQEKRKIHHVDAYIRD